MSLCSLCSVRWMNKWGTLVEWYWQGQTTVLGEKLVSLPFYLPQILHELSWGWAGACVGGQWLTAWPWHGLNVFKINFNIIIPLCLSFPSGLFTSCFMVKVRHFSSLLYAPHGLPISFSLIEHHNNIWWRVYK